MQCPFYRYWICHVVLALAIAAVVGLLAGFVSHPLLLACLAAGACFYIGREIAQGQIYHVWDHKGWAAPLLACLVILLLIEFVVPASAARASWYGPGFHGRQTASGERFNQHASTCAHRTARFGSLIRVTNLANGRSAVCRVNDRGPYVAGRVIDVSRGIAVRLGMIRSGSVPVRLQILE